MRWFRENRVVGGRLALFALALQLVLSFGHVHREDIYGAASASARLAALVVPPPADASRSLPANQPSHRTDDYCAICATMHLLGASFVADAPQLPLPFVTQAIVHVDRVTLVFIAPQRAPFQPRAPPPA